MPKKSMKRLLILLKKTIKSRCWIWVTLLRNNPIPIQDCSRLRRMNFLTNFKGEISEPDLPHTELTLPMTRCTIAKPSQTTLKLRLMRMRMIIKKKSDIWSKWDSNLKAILTTILATWKVQEKALQCNSSMGTEIITHLAIVSTNIIPATINQV